MQPDHPQICSDPHQENQELLEFFVRCLAPIALLECPQLSSFGKNMLMFWFGGMSQLIDSH
jgi:hypothetical protein